MLQIIRNIVALVFGVITTAAFADILQEKRNRIRLGMAASAILLLQGCFLITVGMDWTLALYPLHTHFVLVLALIFLFQCKWTDAVLDTLLAYMCCQIPAWISRLAMYASFKSKEMELVIYIIAVCFSLYFICFFAAKPIHGLTQSTGRSAFVFSIVPITYYLFDYTTTVWTKLLYTGNYHIAQFMPLVVCVSYLVFAIVFDREQKKWIQAKEEQTLLENELHNVESEMESLSELERKTQIFRHDMRHHLSLILLFLEQGQISEAENYIQENLKTINAFTPKRYCDIKILNLLLSHFAGRAQEAGIEYKFDIRLPEKLPLSNTEICTLVSNALENAFEATEKLPEKERRVEVCFCEYNHQLVLSIDNSCNGEVSIRDNVPQTSRERQEHGYGTRSILSIAKEHGGMAVFQVKDKIFSLIITIPLQP